MKNLDPDMRQRDVEWDCKQGQEMERAEKEQQETDMEVPLMKRNLRRYVKNCRM